MNKINYTLKDVIKMTKLSERTIRRYIANGTLKGFKVGGEWRFSEEQIKELFSRKEFTKKLVEETSSQVKKFLNGNTKTTKNHRVCAIFDFLDVTKEQFSLIKKIVMFVSSKHTELDMKMIEDDEDVRVVLTGDTYFIEECAEQFKEVVEMKK